MRIQCITRGNSCAKPSFAGIWGEKRFVGKESSDRYSCDRFELKYFPFLEESEDEIQKTIKQKQEKFKKLEQEQNARYRDIPDIVVFSENTDVKRGRKLEITSLECEQLAEALDKEMPNTIEELNRLLGAFKKISKLIK